MFHGQTFYWCTVLKSVLISDFQRSKIIEVHCFKFKGSKFKCYKMRRF